MSELLRGRRAHRRLQRMIERLLSCSIAAAAAVLAPVAIDSNSTTQRKSTEMESLNSTAKTEGLIFGAAAAQQVIPGQSGYDAAYEALYKQHCGIITTDIAMKWNRLWPTADMKPTWADADALVNWAEQNNIQVKGHNLVWNEYNPAWLWTDSSTAPDYGTLKVSVEEAAYAFDKSISELIGRYEHRVRIWDVVNEPIEPAHGRADGMRSKTWLKVFGPKYVERALLRAHAADPTAKLFINEQGLDKMGSEVNRVKFLALIDRVLDAGVPLHGVGLESHLVLWGNVTREGMLWLISELQKRNLEVHISEFDIAYYGGSGQALPATVTDIPTVDAFVANAATSFLNDVLQFPNVKALITWELADKYSWQVKNQPRCLPFDSNYQPKPFATAIGTAMLNRSPED
jgi:endo-1,4-beta-xylanase